MGFLDRLFGRKKVEPESSTPTEAPAASVSAGPAPASGWRQRIAAAAKRPGFDWEWGNAPAHQIVHALLAEAQPHFGTADKPAKIKERPDDENIDLRGSYGGSPIRFAVWMSFGNFWTIEMKVPMNLHLIQLDRDLEKVPAVGDEDDPFDEDDERRVFVGKGVFFEGSEEDVSQRLERWQQLPEPVRDDIVEAMGQLDARGLYYAGDKIILNQAPGLPDLDDPIDYMRACGDLLVKLRDAVANASFPDLVAGVVQPTPDLRVTCKYCSSLYFLSPGHPRCPNCGAPAQE